MLDVILACSRSRLSGCQSRRLLILENLAFRGELRVRKRQTPKPKLRQADRLLWLALRRLWPDWQRTFVLVLATSRISLGELHAALLAPVALRGV